MFYFFPANLKSSNDTDRNSPFSRFANKHSQFGTLSHPYFKKTFSNFSSHKFLCYMGGTVTTAFSRCANKHSQLETFSQPYFNRIFSNCLSIIVLPKDDSTDSAQEEHLDLPYWTMIWAISVSVDESKYLDIQTLEFSITSVQLPF